MKLDHFFDVVGGDPELQRLIELLQLLSPEDKKEFLTSLQESNPEHAKFLMEFFEVEISDAT